MVRPSSLRAAAAAAGSGLREEISPMPLLLSRMAIADVGEYAGHLGVLDGSGRVREEGAP